MDTTGGGHAATQHDSQDSGQQLTGAHDRDDSIPEGGANMTM